MAETIKVSALPQAHCKDCSLAPLCLPLSLTVEDMDSLDEIVKRGRPLKKGEFLFRQGDPFGSVFAVRSGALKTFSITDAGEEQITGFHLPSELVGLSGIPRPIRYPPRPWKPPRSARFPSSAWTNCPSSCRNCAAN